LPLAARQQVGSAVVLVGLGEVGIDSSLGIGGWEIQSQCDQEIHEARNHGSRRHDQPREIDFGDQVGIADDAAARFAERLEKNCQGSIAANTSNGYGTPPGASSFATLLKTTVKTIIVTRGLISTQATPITVCL